MVDILADIVDVKDSQRIKIDAPYIYKDRITAIAGSKYDKKTLMWTIPLSWQSCLALRSTFGEKLTIGKRLADWAAEWRQTRIDPALALRQATDAPGYADLFPHQRAGVAFLRTAHRAILADAPGLGKTRTSVATLRRLYEEGETVFPALVVTVNSAKRSWAREIEEVWPGLTVQVVDGSATQRRKQLKTPAHIYIMNWEALAPHSRLQSYGSTALRRCPECGGADPKITTAKCQVHVKELNEIPLKSVIADEAHKIKDPATQFSRALKAATGDAEYRIALTGTPIANHPGDLWSILNWLYPDGYPASTKFIDRLLDVSYPVFGGVEILGIKPEAQWEFFGGLDPILRRMTKESAGIKLPPKIFERRDVELSPKQKKAYKELEENMVAMLDNGDMLLVDSKLTQMGRLLQFAAAYGEVETKQFIDKDGEQKTRTLVHLTEPSAKLDAFMEDMEGFGDESVAVFHPSKQVIDLLAARLDKKGVPYGRITGDESTAHRQVHMDAFQKGKVKYILCTTGAGGISVTLTKASICVRLGRSWSNVDDLQAEDRTHRIGSEQHDSILYIDYVSKGTVEERVMDALEKKNMSLQEILRDEQLMNSILRNEEED